ncbi:MAG: hypothetical protein HUJ94_08005 [Bacteroidales bacterium]|nr:hypothetical protein [Bacteroidales bacterium]
MKNLRIYGSRLLLVLAAAATLSCQEIKDELDSIRDEISSLRNVRIASIKDQIKGINQTLVELKEMDVAINGHLETLELVDGELEAAITELDRRVVSVSDSLRDTVTFHRSKMEAMVGTAKTQVRLELEAFKAEADGVLEFLNSYIEELRQDDTILWKMTDTIRIYMDERLAETGDWAAATLMTIEKHDSLADVVSELEARQEALELALESLDASISSRLEAAVKAASQTFDENLANDIKNLLASCAEAISSAKEDITASYRSKVAGAVESTEASLKEWAGVELEAYCTSSALEAKLSALESEYDMVLAAKKKGYERMMEILDSTVRLGIDTTLARIKVLEECAATLTEDQQALAVRIINAGRDIASNSEKVLGNRTIIDDLLADSTIIEENEKLVEENAKLIAEISDRLQELLKITPAPDEDITKFEKAVNAEAQSLADNASLLAANTKSIINNRALTIRNRTVIDSLLTEVGKTRETMSAEFAGIITAAIEEADGEIDDAVSARIEAANAAASLKLSSMESKISIMQLEVASLTSNLDGVEKQLDDLTKEIEDVQSAMRTLLGRVQSVSYVRTDGNYLYFEVKPASVVPQIVLLHNTLGEIIQLEVEGLEGEESLNSTVSVSDGLLKLEYSLPEGSAPEGLNRRACLVIDYERLYTSISSDYFNIVL